MPSLVPSFCHASHAPLDSLSYPSSLLPLLTPRWQGYHLGPMTPEGYSVVSGLTHGDEVAGF